MAGKWAAEPEFEDTSCYHCGRMSCGIAWRDGDKRWSPLRFVCVKCSEALMELRDVRDFDRLELHALEGGVELVAKYLHEINCTDLSKMTELDARMIVKYAVEGFGNDVRRLAATGKY